MLAAWAGESAVMSVASPMIILALALAGLAAQYAQRLRYVRELALIETARHRLEGASAGSELDTRLPRGSETARRVQTISRLAAAGQPPRTADLSTATALRDEAMPSSRLARLLLSSLLILGLLGTLGAFRGVLGEPPSGDEEGRIDAAKLDSYVRDVYRGLGGAFYASMAGVGGTVLLLISRAMIVTGARNAYRSELDSFTEEDLIPKLYRAPTPAPQALSEASHLMRSVTQDLGQLGDGLREALIGAQASATNLQRFSEALREGAETLGATFESGGSAERQFTSLAASMVRQEAIIEEATAEAGADRAALREAIGNLSQLGEAVVLWQHAAGGLLEQFSKSQETQCILTQKTAEALAAGVSHLVKITTEQQERQHREQAAWLGKSVEALNASATRLANQAGELELQRQGSHAALIKEMTRGLGRFESAAQEFKKLTTSLQTASDRHFEMIQSFGQQMADAGKNQSASMQALLEALRRATIPAAPVIVPPPLAPTFPVNPLPRPTDRIRRWFGGT